MAFLAGAVLISDDRGRPTGTQAIERAVSVLRCFEQYAELSATEIAHETSLNLGTASRIIRALRNAGLLQQDPFSERYQLGVGTALLGRLAQERIGLSAAYPLLVSLGRSTGESVNLGVQDWASSLTVLHVPSTNALRVEQQPGTRNPLYACSMGKVLLAFGPGLGNWQWDYEPFTERTIGSDSRLKAEIDTVREAGYALNDEERNVGVRAISAPVFDRQGVARAAVAVQGPSARITDARVPVIAAATIAAAGELSSLGFMLG